VCSHPLPSRGAAPQPALARPPVGFWPRARETCHWIVYPVAITECLHVLIRRSSFALPLRLRGKGKRETDDRTLLLCYSATVCSATYRPSATVTSSCPVHYLQHHSSYYFRPQTRTRAHIHSTLPLPYGSPSPHTLPGLCRPRRPLRSSPPDTKHPPATLPLCSLCLLLPGRPDLICSALLCLFQTLRALSPPPLGAQLTGPNFPSLLTHSISPPAWPGCALCVQQDHRPPPPLEKSARQPGPPTVVSTSQALSLSCPFPPAARPLDPASLESEVRLLVSSCPGRVFSCCPTWRSALLLCIISLPGPALRRSGGSISGPPTVGPALGLTLSRDLPVAEKVWKRKAGPTRVPLQSRPRQAAGCRSAQTDADLTERALADFPSPI
jgi:hypothetical protein